MTVGDWLRAHFRWPEHERDVILSTVAHEEYERRERELRTQQILLRDYVDLIRRIERRENG